MKVELNNRTKLMIAITAIAVVAAVFMAYKSFGEQQSPESAAKSIDFVKPLNAPADAPR